MAYIANPLQDEEEKAGVLQGTEGEGVKQITQATDVLQQGGTEDAGQLGTGQTAPTGGMDVNEQQKYLDVNKEKAYGLGTKAANVITGDITGAQNALTGAGQQYNQAVQQGTVNLNQDIYGRAMGLVDQGQFGATTQGFLNNQGDRQAFQNMYNAQYGGPSDITTQDYYQEAQKAAEKAQRTAGLVEDSTGRQEILARTYDRPSGRFSRGSLALDESLLTGYEDAYQQLLDAAQGSGSLEGQNQNITQQAQQAYQQGLSTTEATRQAMRDAFKIGGEEQEIRDRAEQIKQQAARDFAQYRSDIDRNYSPATHEGISAWDYYTNPNEYQNINAQNVASAEDYARLQALQELTGATSTLTPFSAQAGQYTQYTDPNDNFRYNEYNNRVNQARAQRKAQEQAERDRVAAQQAAQQAAAQQAAEQQQTSTYQTVGAVGGAAVGAVVGGPVGAVVGGAIGGAIGGIACFDGDSKFEMFNGTHKAIKNISLNDKLAMGGKVYSISQHILNAELYTYPTFKEDEYVYVTGSHAVLEDDKWIRVKDSRRASLVSDHEISHIYSLSCENHIMLSHGVTFADYDEVDNAQGLTDEQCLKVLNKK